MDRKLSQDEAGITTIEYVIILIIVAIGSITAFHRFGDTIDAKVITLAERIENLGIDQLGPLP